MFGAMTLIGIIIGILGSVIVQGIGWEPALKFLNATSFDIADPHFGKDVSFYIFILPFIQFVLFTLLNLAIFFLLIQADRKSTRLNSSHVAISYAVFCLK